MNDTMSRLAMLLMGSAPTNTGAIQIPAALPADTGAIAPSLPSSYSGLPNMSASAFDKAKGGGKNNGGKKPSSYQETANKAAVGGPSKYSNIMKKNLGMTNRTIGYGKPVAPQRTGLTRLLDLFSPNGKGMS